MTLENLQQQCLDLAVDIAKNPVCSDFAAGPFISVDALNPRLHPRILYVGQATRGSFWAQQFHDDPTLTARRECIADALRDRGINDHGGFWRFARLLGNLAETNHKTQHVDNIIWSNIMRIGDRRGCNPRSALGHTQWDLLSQTLQEEVKFYKPDVVVFVTNHYWNRVILDICPDWTGGLTPADFTSGKRRLPSSETPPMLWFGHPGRRPRAQLLSWKEKVAEALLGR